jgi:hypothetical protein
MGEGGFGAGVGGTAGPSAPLRSGSTAGQDRRDDNSFVNGDLSELLLIKRNCRSLGSARDDRKEGAAVELKAGVSPVRLGKAGQGKV